MATVLSAAFFCDNDPAQLVSLGALLMATTADWSAAQQVPLPHHWTMADLQKHLGGVPARRIRLFPQPGTATEEDALHVAHHEDRLCELVDGILVEKVMAAYESFLTMTLGFLLNTYLEKNRIGVILGPDGALRILPRRMRIPDVSFISWQRFPGGKLPTDAVFRVAPDLAAEILSKSNTKGEMDLKLREYFEAGVRLVWYIDPRSRTAQIFTDVDACTTIDENSLLEGRDVLPGFQLRLGELFERADRTGTST
jgi:Uma2 family endonuclease